MGGRWTPEEPVLHQVPRQVGVSSSADARGFKNSSTSVTWLCSVLLKYKNFDLKLLKSEMMLWLQYQLSYPVKFHVLVIFNEKESKTKTSKKRQNVLRLTSYFHVRRTWGKSQTPDLPRIFHHCFVFPLWERGPGWAGALSPGPGLCRDRQQTRGSHNHILLLKKK